MQAPLRDNAVRTCSRNAFAGQSDTPGTPAEKPLRIDSRHPLAYLAARWTLMSRKTLLMVLVVLLWLLSVPLACLPGPMDLGWDEVVHLLAFWGGAGSGQPDAVSLMVVSQIRLPRVVLGLIVGGGLAVAGAALQGLLRNPLADPFILGLSAGAACGASAAIAFGARLSVWTAGLALSPAALTVLRDLGLVAPAALLGAFLALFLALALGKTGGLFRRDVVILAGVAVSSFLGALVALIKALDEESVAGIVFWIMGSFQGRGWSELLLLVPVVPGLVLVASRWRDLDLLRLGDDEAASLGVPVRRSRLWVVCGTGCITAGCVAVAGMIGFVGLVAPHILRRLLGSGHGLLLPASWFGGGLLLVWADVLARSLLDQGQELPVGVVTALIGAPFFAWILRRRQGESGRAEGV